MLKALTRPVAPKKYDFAMSRARPSTRETIFPAAIIDVARATPASPAGGGSALGAKPGVLLGAEGMGPDAYNSSLTD